MGKRERLRRAAKKRAKNACEVSGTTRQPTEMHYIKPKFEGGEDELDNVVMVTRPLHATIHRGLAEVAQQKGDRRGTRANQWAFDMIKKRLSPREREWYDLMEKLENGD